MSNKTKQNKFPEEYIYDNGILSKDIVQKDMEELEEYLSSLEKEIDSSGMIQSY